MAAVLTSGMTMHVNLESEPSFWRGKCVRETQKLDLTGKILYGVAFHQEEDGKLQVHVIYLENGTKSEPVPLPPIQLSDVQNLSITFHDS